VMSLATMTRSRVLVVAVVGKVEFAYLVVLDLGGYLLLRPLS
jgi:hypothetical protein